jgi:hypothetical protein
MENKKVKSIEVITHPPTINIFINFIFVFQKTFPTLTAACAGVNKIHWPVCCQYYFVMSAILKIIKIN